MSASPAAAVGRNSPCPCGSGRRYKDCHGSVQPAGAGFAPRPSYRPDGPDWRGVDEAQQESLGRSMDEALAAQNAGDDRTAERLYRGVLVVAPDTHDALHMLGVARWRSGDLTEATSLIERASTLRDPYPAILKNIKSLRRARDARSQRGLERLSEVALPLVLPLLAGERGAGAGSDAGDGRRTGEPLHIVLGTTRIDSDIACVFERLVQLLAPWRPLAWRYDAPAAGGAMRRLDGAAGMAPVGGIQIHVGLECDHVEWLDRALPRRVVVAGVHASASAWLLGLRRVALDGAVPMRAIFLTPGQASHFGVRGPCLPSLVTPLPREGARMAGRVPIVGLVATDQGLESTDRVTDLLLQRSAMVTELHRIGLRVAIRDPGRLRHRVGDLAGVRFEGRADRPMDAFLASVDALLVPPRGWAVEGLQPEIGLALSRGLPVVMLDSSIHAPAAGHPGIHVVGDEAAAIRTIAEWSRSGVPVVPIDARPRPQAESALADAVAEALSIGPREATP